MEKCRVIFLSCKALAKKLDRKGLQIYQSLMCKEREMYSLFSNYKG